MSAFAEKVHAPRRLIPVALRETRHRKAFPALAAELDALLAGEVPRDWDQDLPVFPPDPKGMATREASGRALNALAERYFVTAQASDSMRASRDLNQSEAPMRSACSRTSIPDVARNLAAASRASDSCLK